MIRLLPNLTPLKFSLCSLSPAKLIIIMIIILFGLIALVVVGGYNRGILPYMICEIIHDINMCLMCGFAFCEGIFFHS